MFIWKYSWMHHLGLFSHLHMRRTFLSKMTTPSAATPPVIVFFLLCRDKMYLPLELFILYFQFIHPFCCFGFLLPFLCSRSGKANFISLVFLPVHSFIIFLSLLLITVVLVSGCNGPFSTAHPEDFPILECSFFEEEEKGIWIKEKV